MDVAGRLRCEICEAIIWIRAAKSISSVHTTNDVVVSFGIRRVAKKSRSGICCHDRKSWSGKGNNQHMSSLTTVEPLSLVEPKNGGIFLEQWDGSQATQRRLHSGKRHKVIRSAKEWPSPFEHCGNLDMISHRVRRTPFLGFSSGGDV